MVVVVAAITCNDSEGDSCGGDKIRLVIVGSITLATLIEFVYYTFLHGIWNWELDAKFLLFTSLLIGTRN